MRETIARKHHTKPSRSLSLILSCSSWEQVLAQHYKHLSSGHWGGTEKLYPYLMETIPTKSQKKAPGKGTDIYSGPVMAIMSLWSHNIAE